MHNILRINLNRQTWRFEAAESGPYADIGGRGLTSAIVNAEVPPACDPLGPENKLIFAGGLLAGSAAPNSGRLSVGAKSPLTLTVKEANAGGAAAHKLARIGIGAVVLEGKAHAPVCLKIHMGGVDFIPADPLKHMGNYAVIEDLKRIHGPDIAVISIGPAGEMGMKASGVSVTAPDFHIRTAARGGLGAVMGSKNVKAVVIDDAGGSPSRPQNEALFKESVKALVQGISAHPVIGGLKVFGTPLLVNLINEMGALSTRNYSRGRFEGAENLSGERIAALMKERPNASAVHRCMTGCIVNCSNVFTDPAGNVVVSGLEYETIALMGANCMIDDIDIVARMNRLCNDLGVDTMDVGGAIAVCMEAGRLAWGDGDAALRMIGEIALGTETGRMIGHGCRYAGEKLGVKRIPHVKGQCLAGYDPRVLKGTGVTYATATMGADHTCGNALPSPANPSYNPSSPDGQRQVSRFLQSYFAAVDTLGLCLFASLPALDMPELQGHIIGCVAGLLGKPLDANYLMSLGDSVLKTEREFNRAAGLGPGDDRLPRFFLEEKLEPTGNVFDVPDEDLDRVHG